jgi:pyruvate ferredoxin oxidoreductase beta subunit
MVRTEQSLYEGEVLTGRFYHEADRPAYGEEKRQDGEMPEERLAERYHDDAYEWERSYDLLDAHK